MIPMFSLTDSLWNFNNWPHYLQTYSLPNSEKHGKQDCSNGQMSAAQVQSHHDLFIGENPLINIFISIITPFPINKLNNIPQNFLFGDKIVWIKT